MLFSRVRGGEEGPPTAPCACKAPEHPCSSFLLCAPHTTHHTHTAPCLTAAFNDGLAADQLRCASLLFCVASLGSDGFDQLVDWLGRYLEGDAVDLSLQVSERGLCSCSWAVFG